MTVYPAFQGHFKYGEWLTLLVELENNGPDLQAELRVPITSANGTIYYSTPVELPQSSRKLVPIYVLPNNFSRQLVVELVSNEQSLVSQKINIHPNPNVTYMVGILAPHRGAISLVDRIKIPGVERPKVLVDLTPKDLPEKYEGLRSLDLLIINNADTSKLTPEQKDALESWVNRGGRLVIGGGAGAPITASNLPKSLFPYDLQNIHEVDALPGLEAYADTERPIRIPGPFVIVKVDVSDGRVLSSQNDIPLVVEKKLGKGFIDFIALDLADAPFDAWNGTPVFWEKLVTPNAGYPEWLPTDISARQQFASNMPYTLSNLPMLDLPSAKWLALMLGIYILVVGPANYFFLRRIKRLHYAWLTIPAITILFSAASFSLGYALHGTDIFVNKITVLQAEPNGSALVDSFIGVFSPAQKSYQIEVENAGLLSPLTPYYNPWDSFGNPGTVPANRTIYLTQGNPAYVRGISIDQWSMQSFMSESRMENLGFTTPKLLIEEEALVGSIENTTQHFLEGAFLIWGSNYLNLGDMAPGDSVEVKLDLSKITQPNLGSPFSYSMFEKELNGSAQDASRRQAEVKRSIVENLFERTPPYISSQKLSGTATIQGPVFGGWLEEAPPTIKILGAEPAEQTTAIFLAPVDFEFSLFRLPHYPSGGCPRYAQGNSPRRRNLWNTGGISRVYRPRHSGL